MTNLGIIGCGSSGMALAAQIGLRGGELHCMVDEDAELLEHLRSAGRISLSGHLGTAAFGLPEMTDAYGRLADCDVIFVATTADRHGDVARSLAPVLRDGQLCVLATGYANGAAAFAAGLAAAGCTASGDAVLALNTTPHLSYAPGDGRVHVAAVKSWLEVSGTDAAAVARGTCRLARWLPAAVPARHQLASSLNNPNPVAHVPAAVLNAVSASLEEHSLIPPNGAFHLGDFGAPALDGLRNVLDAERRDVMAALGIGEHFVSRNDFAARAYGPGSREALPPRLGPTFQPRFTTEDVPCGLVPLEQLGEAAGAPTPAITALISMACSLAGEDFRNHPGASVRHQATGYPAQPLLEGITLP